MTALLLLSVIVFCVTLLLLPIHDDDDTEA